jgi:hypothetical protein
VIEAAELAHALDRDHRRPAPSIWRPSAPAPRRDPRSRARAPRSRFGDAVGERRGHHEVLGRPTDGKPSAIACAASAWPRPRRSRGTDGSSPHALEPGEVDVDGTATDRAAAGVETRAWPPRERAVRASGTTPASSSRARRAPRSTSSSRASTRIASNASSPTSAADLRQQAQRGRDVGDARQAADRAALAREERREQQRRPAFLEPLTATVP